MTYRTKSERSLEEIYEAIPEIPGCDGQCVESCGPIAMFKGEWERVKRSAGRRPKATPGAMVCPLLSPTGRCTVYSVRPYICRLWGTTRELACPVGCQPDRWLSTEEAHDIFERIKAVAGPEVDGPLGGLDDLWKALDLEGRAQRRADEQRLGRGEWTP